MIMEDKIDNKLRQLKAENQALRLKLDKALKVVEAARECVGIDADNKAQFQPNCDGEAQDLIDALAAFDALRRGPVKAELRVRSSLGPPYFCPWVA